MEPDTNEYKNRMSTINVVIASSSPFMQHGITHILGNIAASLNIKKAKNHREFSSAVRASSEGLLITDETMPDFNAKDMQALSTNEIRPWLKIAVYHRYKSATGKNSSKNNCYYSTSKLVRISSTPDIAMLQDTIATMLLYFKR